MRLQWLVLISGLHLRMLHGILREVAKIWTLTPFSADLNTHFLEIFKKKLPFLSIYCPIIDLIFGKSYFFALKLKKLIFKLYLGNLRGFYLNIWTKIAKSANNLKIQQFFDRLTVKNGLFPTISSDSVSRDYLAQKMRPGWPQQF